MQTLSAWVWEHIQNIVLWFVKVIRICFESFVICPVLLPLLFNLFVIVTHVLSSD